MIQQIEMNTFFRIQPGATTEPIVYLHGLGESGLCFEKLIRSPHLAYWMHFVPDLVGYGKTPGNQPVSLATHAENLAQWIKSRELPPVILFGHSMGGVIGQLFCENFPELVRAFVNVEGNISLGDCSFSSQVARYPEGEFLARGFESLLNSIFLSGDTDSVLRNYFASMRFCDPRTLYLNSIELVEISTGETLARRMGKLNIPSIYLLGNPRGTGAHSQSLLTAAGVRYQKIDDAGHWPFLDQPAAFISALRDFLDSI